MRITFTHTTPNPEHDAISEQMAEYHKTREKRLAISRQPTTLVEVEINREYRALEDKRAKIDEELTATVEAEIVGSIMSPSGPRFIVATEDLKFICIPCSECTVLTPKCKVGTTK